jgi:hypothetical protein
LYFAGGSSSDRYLTLDTTKATAAATTMTAIMMMLTLGTGAVNLKLLFEQNINRCAFVLSSTVRNSALSLGSDRGAGDKGVSDQSSALT